MKAINQIILLIIIISCPVLAVDTLHCIANYEFQTPMSEREFMQIRALGDVNADGFDDWAYVFYSRNTFAKPDSVWVFFGDDTIDFTCDYILRANDIASIGDVNNDGYDDIGYLYVKMNNLYISGDPKLHVLYGGPDFDFISDNICIVDAGGQHAEFSPIGTVGDINGDGYDDIFSGVYNQINATQRIKNYIHFGSDDISSTPNVILYPPPNIETYTEEVYKWGEYYSSIGDVNEDGFNDFSLLFASRPPYTDYPRVLYSYLGNSSSDSIISSVDTLTTGFITDFYQTGNSFGEENGIMIYYEYSDYLYLFSIDSTQTIHRFNSVQKLTRSYGDINNDGYNDWVLLFYNPLLYNGYFGGSTLDTVADFFLPANNKPTAIYPSYVNSSFIGDICGDGYDKLMVIETDKRFPATNDDADYFYHVYCYSYNRVETTTKSHTPSSFTLSQNYPNPFNPITTIEYTTLKDHDVKLSIYDINGYLVEVLVDEYHLVGVYNVKWDASKYSSGIYIYRLEYGNHQISRKMVLMK
ncbi:MAG: T9SS type A sorting domain-containing protein [Candidatus Marinimicrobia bacterium]|nr:T9SS type A sorting domain-containing protein [Candidatus Neomarinimicrobiota bacterium]